MRAFLARHIVGVFAFDGKGKLIGHKLFKKDPEEIADKLTKTSAIPEEKDLVNELSEKGYDEIVWDKKEKVKGVKVLYEPESVAQKSVNEQFRKLAIDLKWIASQADLNILLTRVNVLRTKTRMRVSRPDVLLMRVVGAIDEVERELNTFSELLKEWYGLYFPEASQLVKSNERFWKVVMYGRREDIPEQDLKRAARRTSGMEFTDEDIAMMESFAKRLQELNETKTELTKYLEKSCKETVPNLSAIAGPVLAARLLSLSGGLERMAKMPSSTIQLLGAEKSLFRHLKEQTKAPKYGVLFAHPYIQQAKPEKRGKVARLIAAKLSLAARTDFFTKADKSTKMKKELDAEVQKVLG